MGLHCLEVTPWHAHLGFQVPRNQHPYSSPRIQDNSWFCCTLATWKRQVWKTPAMKPALQPWLSHAEPENTLSLEHQEDSSMQHPQEDTASTLESRFWRQIPMCSCLPRRRMMSWLSMSRLGWGFSQESPTELCSYFKGETSLQVSPGTTRYGHVMGVCHFRVSLRGTMLSCQQPSTTIRGIGATCVTCHVPSFMSASDHPNYMRLPSGPGSKQDLAVDVHQVVNR